MKRKCSYCQNELSENEYAQKELSVCKKCHEKITQKQKTKTHRMHLLYLAVIPIGIGLMVWMYPVPQPNKKHALPKGTTKLKENDRDVNYIYESIAFKPVKELSDGEANYLLRIAMNKMQKIITEQYTVGSSWVTIHAKPLSNTELELLGDYFLEEMNRIYGYTAGLKMQVFWNNDVASVATANEYYCESQFYNSFWNQGERAVVNMSGELKAFSEEGLYHCMLSSDVFLWCTVVDYDYENKMLELETAVNCMNELIFNTFYGVGDDSRFCAFDRIPDLKAVKIVYRDANNEIIGEGTFDINYWIAKIREGIFPQDIFDEEFDVMNNLRRKHTSKLIGEKQFYKESEQVTKYFRRLKERHYQEKWLRLYPKLIGFKLNRELPLECLTELK